MKNLAKISIFFITMLILNTQVVFAGSAFNRSVQITQPNGKTFMATLHGDEWNNWVEEETTGAVVIQDEDNYWKYATVISQKIKATESIVGVNPIPSKILKADDLKSNIIKERPKGVIVNRPKIKMNQALDSKTA